MKTFIIKELSVFLLLFVFSLSIHAQYINSLYDVRDGEITFYGNTMLINHAGKRNAITIGEESIVDIDLRPVDLGLPSGNLWASCNIGASKPEEIGWYLAWGEIEQKDVYNYDNSIWKTTKICDHDTSCLFPQYDSAKRLWGGKWVMPSNTDAKELIQICVWTWGVLNGIKGVYVKGPNGNSIFLPSGGCMYYNNGLSSENKGYYWTTGYYWTGDSGCYYIAFSEKSKDLVWRSNPYYYGQTIRPVFKPNEK